MGNTKTIPVVGEVVTAVETGTKVTAAGALAIVCYLTNTNNPCFKRSKQLLDGAEKAVIEYTEKNIIAGWINRQIQLGNGNKQEADRIGHIMLDSANGLLNHTPIVGHAKGVIHYVTGNAEQGNDCMIGASRGVVVLAAGAVTGGVGAGLVVAGLAGVGTGLVYDKTATFIDSKINNEERLHGTMSTIGQYNKTGDFNALVDLTLTAGCDFMTAAAAQRAVKTRQLKNEKQGSSQVPATKKGSSQIIEEEIDIQINVNIKEKGHFDSLNRLQL